MSDMAIYQQLIESALVDAERQRLIDRAKELNAGSFSVSEMQERIREVCSQHLIEAKVDVDRLLKHEDWQVRLSALDIVWSGLGVTDGIETTKELLLHDADEDIRAHSALALYEVAKGTSKEAAVRAVFRRVAEDDASDYVRDSVLGYLRKFDQRD